jgi:hypothetical protein
MAGTTEVEGPRLPALPARKSLGDFSVTKGHAGLQDSCRPAATQAEEEQETPVTLLPTVVPPARVHRRSGEGLQELRRSRVLPSSLGSFKVRRHRQ